MNNFLGIDWGGTYIKAGVINEAGQILCSHSFSSQELTQKKAFLDKIGSLVEEYRRYKIRAIGIGAPGIVDMRKGSIYYLPNIPGWKNYPLREILQKKTGLPVAIDNDANAFALAEAQLGAGKGTDHVIFLTLGTGLGGAIVVEGKLLEARTSALELGHVPISLSGKPCSCGGSGCIETFTGSKHLIKRYQAISGKKDVSEVLDIFERAMRAEAAAMRTWEEFSFALGKFLVGMINIFNPEVIVFGGGVSGAFKVFKPMVTKVIQKEAMWPQLKNITLKQAKLKDAGIIGAGLLARGVLLRNKKRNVVR